jgi:hypothetical protein
VIANIVPLCNAHLQLSCANVTHAANTSESDAFDSSCAPRQSFEHIALNVYTRLRAHQRTRDTTPQLRLSCCCSPFLTHTHRCVHKRALDTRYPSDPSHDKTAAVTLTPVDPTHGLNSTNFTLARFTTTDCQVSTRMPNDETISLGVCHNRSVTPGTGVMAWMWVRAYIPPP